MSFERAARIADAVLLEGYVLYPYRACSTKNRYRWTFGVLAPRRWSEHGGCEPWWLAAQVLARRAPTVRGRLRFLRIVDRRVEALQVRDAVWVDTRELDAGGVVWSAWEEGETVEVDFEASPGGVFPIALAASRDTELVRDGHGTVIGRLTRTRAGLEGVIRTELEPRGTAMRLSVRVENLTPIAKDDESAPRATMMKASFASTHLLLEALAGEFVSAVDPPEELRQAAAGCHNVGTFPSLVGDDEAAGEDGLVLCAPILLGDRPRIAPESRGDLFDACEIDEILALRTQNLTPHEKARARGTDARAAAILDRVDAFGADVMSELHGAVREKRVITALDGAVRTACARGTPPRALGPGARVRIKAAPSAGGRRTDAQDLLYVGCTAQVESVKEDVDGTTYLALTIEGDPAAELHRWYGRFHYYRIDEVDPL